MKTQFFRFTLYAIIIYLTSAALNPAVAASQPSGGNGPYLCGVIDCQPQFHRDSKQPDNRNYARTFVDGQYPDSHYLDHTPATVGPEINTVFNLM